MFMDKIVSTRIDQELAALWDRLARRKKLSKKAVLEEALLLYAKIMDEQSEMSALEESFGAWNRPEPAQDIFNRLREDQAAGLEQRNKA
jgi:predicted transcriptional regulator